MSDSFTIITLTVDGFYVDTVDYGLVLNSKCNYPCEECSLVDSSECRSCFRNGALPFLQLGTCTRGCSTGFYDNGNGECLECGPNCLGCFGSADSCTACGIGNLLYLHENDCKSSCPSGFFADKETNKCEAC